MVISLDPGLILQKFIQDKMEHYHEPARRGTPKGQPIGFPRSKYLASMLMLTAGSLKEISKSSKISYGVLRKWLTEPSFKEQIDENYKDFKTFFWRLFEDDSERHSNSDIHSRAHAWIENLNSSYADDKNRKVVPLCPRLRETLLEGLRELMDSELQKPAPCLRRVWLISLISQEMLLTAPGMGKIDRFLNATLRMMNSACGLTLTKAINVLTGDIPDEEKMVASNLLTLIRQILLSREERIPSGRPAKHHDEKGDPH